MLKSELIAKLQAIEGDPEVIVTSSNFELNNALVGLTSVTEYRVTKKYETFRDAFDGDTYSKEVYKLVGGTTTAIYIG